MLHLRRAFVIGTTTPPTMPSINAASFSNASRFSLAELNLVIAASDAAHHVAQAHLADVGANASAAQQRAACSSQIVQRVVR